MLSLSSCDIEGILGELNGILGDSGDNGEAPGSGAVSDFDLSIVPLYSDSPYYIINNNQPFFTDEEIVSESYELYGELDPLGRCTLTMACIGKDLMPTEKREGLDTKPTGRINKSYDIVSGGYLYNRCHLIGFQLTGENDNEKNLITGTRYMNWDGMVEFENMTADYIKETNNHVMYRATPIFYGDNLLASGVLLEAYSVEDNGEGICFNVFIYNVQPGIALDYSTGDSRLLEDADELTGDLIGGFGQPSKDDNDNGEENPSGGTENESGTEQKPDSGNENENGTEPTPGAGNENENGGAEGDNMQDNENNNPADTPTDTPNDTPTDTPTDTPADKVEEKWDVTVGNVTVPEYSGSSAYVINGNVPNFTEDEIVTDSYELYGELDSLGRCTYTIACVGKDIMPTESRGDISSVFPTGWVQKKINGQYLYHRCHLIGFQLTGENANERNLITGTQYMNLNGMLEFENAVADYIKETNNHVMYRVTPIFVGDNLLASGVQLEAYSVEDEGEGISYNVFIYNVQPGVTLDYKTGASIVEEQDEVENENESGSTDCTYILNTYSKKVHLSGCRHVENMSESNKEETNKTEEELLEEGYVACLTCDPFG